MPILQNFQLAFHIRLCNNIISFLWEMAMSSAETTALKKDLFAWPKSRRGATNKFKRDIPNHSDWRKEHGSWAVKMGIVKFSDGRVS
jgi:hypothetical protein